MEVPKKTPNRQSLSVSRPPMDPVGGGQLLPPETTTAYAAAISSSLSPLAPPFTLERRLPSSASSNHFTFWLDPSSSYHTSSSLPREIYGGYVTAPGITSGAPVLASTGLHEVEYYPRLLTTSSAVEPNSAFLSNSPFDTSTYTVDYIASASSNSGQVITSAIRTSSSNGYCASDAAYPMVNHLSPYSMDTDNLIAKVKQTSINHGSVSSKLGYNENIQDDNKLTRRIYISGNFGKGLHSSSKVVSKGMADYSTEVTSGLKMKHLVLPKASAPTCGSVLSNDQKQNSLERVDSLEQDVDSPCWKGTSVSQQAPFNVGEQPSPYPVVRESEGSNDLSPEQKHLSSCAIYCESVAEQSSTFDSSKSDQKFSASPMVLSSIISPRIKKKSEEASRIKLDYPNSRGKAILCSDICQEQRIEDKKRNAEVYYNDAAESVTKGSCVSPHNLVLENQNSDPKKGPCSSREKHIQVLVKAMHSLSEMLLGTICNGDYRLVEQDNKLLHLVIDNLQTLLHENKKDTSPAM